MNLGVFLAIGESFKDFKNKGQDVLIVDYLLKNYSRNFDKVFVFSYREEEFVLFDNVYILPNKWRIHRYLYSLFLPFLYPRIISSCSILRGLQLTGGLPAVASRIFFGKKSIINYGYNYQQFAKIERKPVQAFLYQMIERFILNFCVAIIVTAPYLKKYLLKNLSKNKVQLIPNGVDVDLFQKRQVQTKYDIVYVGRFEKQKNLANLIKAVSLLSSNQTLLFVGQGSQREELVKLAHQRNIRLIIKDTVSHSKVPAILQQARVFVLPSLIEGQPKILLEAMACEMPVVASDIIAHREIIKHGVNGILCDTKPEYLAAVLSRILKDTHLQKKLSRNARTTIMRLYNMVLLNKKEIALLYRLGKIA